MKERIKFDRMYNKFNEEEKSKQMLQRSELVEDLNRVINEEGQPYFSSEWVEKNILNSKQ
jgi:RNA polymerase-interacting CarD/CdnL/TRCF family regulator